MLMCSPVTDQYLLPISDTPLLKTIIVVLILLVTSFMILFTVNTERKVLFPAGNLVL